MYCQTFCLNRNKHQKPFISKSRTGNWKTGVPVRTTCNNNGKLLTSLKAIFTRVSWWSFKDNLPIFTSNLPHLTNQKNSPQSNHPKIRPPRRLYGGHRVDPTPIATQGPRYWATKKKAGYFPMEILVSEAIHPNKNWVVVCHPPTKYPDTLQKNR